MNTNVYYSVQSAQFSFTPSNSMFLLLWHTNTDMQYGAWGQAKKGGQTIPGGHCFPEAWLKDERRQRISRLSVCSLTTACLFVCVLNTPNGYSLIQNTSQTYSNNRFTPTHPHIISIQQHHWEQTQANHKFLSETKKQISNMQGQGRTSWGFVVNVKAWRTHSSSETRTIEPTMHWSVIVFYR